MGQTYRWKWVAASPSSPKLGGPQTELTWIDTALVHHLRDISLLYLSTTSHPPPASSGFVNVPSQNNTSSPAAVASGGSSASSGDVVSNATSVSNTSTSQSTSSFVHIPHPHLRHKHQATEAIDGAATSTGVVIASSSSTTLQQVVHHGRRATYLRSGDLDGDDGEGADTWSEEGRWWTSTSGDRSDEVSEGIKSLQSQIAGGKLRPSELQVSTWGTLLTVVCKTHPGIPSACLRRTRCSDGSVRCV
jgi:hypothetical protein